MGLLPDGETNDFRFTQFQHKLNMQLTYCIHFDS